MLRSDDWREVAHLSTTLHGLVLARMVEQDREEGTNTAEWLRDTTLIDGAAWSVWAARAAEYLVTMRVEPSTGLLLRIAAAIHDGVDGWTAAKREARKEGYNA